MRGMHAPNESRCAACTLRMSHGCAVPCLTRLVVFVARPLLRITENESLRGWCYGLGRFTHRLHQRSQAVVDQGLRPGVLVGDASGSFPVGQQVFLRLGGLAFEVVCFLSRPPCLDKDRLMSCTAVTAFPQGAAQFCICCPLVWPNNPR